MRHNKLEVPSSIHAHDVKEAELVFPYRVHLGAPSRVAYLGTLRRSKGAPQGGAVRPQRYPKTSQWEIRYKVDDS